MAKKAEFELKAEDGAHILASTIEVLREVGLTVGLRNAPAKNGREAGVMLFIGGLQIQGDGLVCLPQNEVTEQ